MLTIPRNTAGFHAAILAVALVATSCTSGVDSQTAPPITVAAADAESDVGIDAINVGLVLNTASPTAARDARLVDVLAASAEAVSASQPVEVLIDTVTISDLDDAPAAVRELVNRGVTVIATSCDNLSMPTVVDAAIDEQLLAVTGCVAIPKPELDVSSRLFIDLASLDDAPAAMANWADTQDLTSLAVLSSNLIPDVDQTCADIAEFASAPPKAIDVSVDGSFVGLVDDPETLVASLGEGLASVDAIVVCALAPALGDVVAALRSAGNEQPILVPWFGEPQRWDPQLTDIFLFSPSSVHGDDPVAEVTNLLDSIEEAEAVDVVAADTLAALATSVTRSNSVGSRRIADATRGSTIDVLSGEIAVGQGIQLPVARSYRVLEVADGNLAFVETVAGG